MSLVRIGVVGCVAFLCTSAELKAEKLRLDDYLKRVFARNEAVQIRLLEAALQDKRYQGEKWIFEPQLFNNLQAVDRRRPNTVQETLGQGLRPTPDFAERNQTFQSGVEMLTPIGSTLRVSYGMSRLRNSLNDTAFSGGEYLASAGIDLRQPLLRGAGTGVTMAGIRIAALGSEIGYQDYRRGLMQVMAQAEAAYWDVYLAQEQFKIAQESVKLADTILKDSEERVKVGKASELDVLQAKSGLAERKALENEARQRVRQAVNSALDLMMTSAVASTNRLRAVDSPQLQRVSLNTGLYHDQAILMNPDYLALKLERDQNAVRLKAAKDEQLPELDLTFGYSVAGLDGSPGGANGQARRQNFPIWSGGLELRVPLGGNVRAKRIAEAASMQVKASDLAVKGAVVQIDNLIETAVQNVRSVRDSVGNYQTVVEFNEKLLETQLARLEVGKVNSREVFETESDLFDSRINHLSSLVAFERAVLQLESVSGTLLDNRNLEITRSELVTRTKRIVNRDGINDTQFREFVHEMQERYRRERKN